MEVCYWKYCGQEKEDVQERNASHRHTKDWGSDLHRAG